MLKRLHNTRSGCHSYESRVNVPYIFILAALWRSFLFPFIIKKYLVQILHMALFEILKVPHNTKIYTFEHPTSKDSNLNVLLNCLYKLSIWLYIFIAQLLNVSGLRTADHEFYSAWGFCTETYNYLFMLC